MKYKIYVQYSDGSDNGYWLSTVYPYKSVAEKDAKYLNNTLATLRSYEVREYCYI